MTAAIPFGANSNVLMIVFGLVLVFFFGVWIIIQAVASAKRFLDAD